VADLTRDEQQMGYERSCITLVVRVFPEHIFGLPGSVDGPRATGYFQTIVYAAGRFKYGLITGRLQCER
jgi:hypothetical protein